MPTMCEEHKKAPVGLSTWSSGNTDQLFLKHFWGLRKSFLENTISKPRPAR